MAPSNTQTKNPAKGLSIRAHLLVLFIGMIIPIATLTVYEIRQSINAIEGEADKNAVRLSRVAARDASLLVLNTRTMLDEIAKRPSVNNLDTETCDPVFGTFLTYNHTYANLVTKKTDGTIVCSSLPLKKLGITKADNEYSVDPLVKLQAFSIGLPHKGNVSGHWIITMEQPIFDNSHQLIGMVGASIDLDRFHPLVVGSAFINLPNGTIATIFNEHGTIIARSQDSEKWVGTNRSKSSTLSHLLNQHDETVTAVSGLDNIERLSAVSPVEGTKWLAVVGIPTSTKDELIKHLIIRWLIAILIGLSLLSVLILWVEKRIAQPIIRLASVAHDISLGKYNIRACKKMRSTVSEVNNVAFQFDEMLDKLDMERKAVERANKDILLINNELEMRVDRRTESLKLLNEELIIARDEADAASKAKSIFLANMSHELRTPLNAIMGFSEIIMQPSNCSGDSSRCAERTSMINESGRHLLGVVDTILDILKIETGSMTLDIIEVPIVNIVHHSIHRLQAAIDDKGHLVHVDVDNTIPDILADERAGVHILTNILTNSIKFTPNGGHIKLSAALHGEYIAISISDNGIGIPQHLLQKVLKPFEQADNRYARTYGGTGLGLAIVSGLVKLHSGSLTIESKVGEGTTVTVYFPTAISIGSPSLDSDT